MLILEAKKSKSHANSIAAAPKPSRMVAGPNIILNCNLLNWSTHCPGQHGSAGWSIVL